VPGVPYNHALEEWFMPNPDRIANAVRRLAAY
jgi:2-oxoisovalerate dehydrogenase E1 component beta subunit